MAESESGQEKTEEATPKRLDKAKEDGQVARSKELNTTVVVMAGVIGLIFFGAEIGESLLRVMRMSFVLPREAAFDTALVIQILYSCAGIALFSLIPLFLMLTVAALLAPVSLGGWLFSTKALTPKLERMDPIKGFKRLFSMTALVELLKAIGKFVLIGGVSLLLLSVLKQELLTLGNEALSPALIHTFTIVVWAVLFVSCSMIVISAIDIPYQIFDHSKKLKMTRQEVKDEYKDTEGKPEVKSRIRQLQRELAQRRMMEAVPEADVVITNPEHFSVALKYAVGQQGAPVVIAKGADHVALKIREIARHHEIEILPSPILCRAIYFTTELEDEIPAGLYHVVAQVLAYVYQLKAYRARKGTKPKALDELRIPSDLQFDSGGKLIH